MTQRDIAHGHRSRERNKEQTEANVRRVASGAAELQPDPRGSARRVTEASKISASGDPATAHSRTRWTGLSASAARIGAVVNLHKTIAAADNLMLALNAPSGRRGPRPAGVAGSGIEVKSPRHEDQQGNEEIGGQIAACRPQRRRRWARRARISPPLNTINEIPRRFAARSGTGRGDQGIASTCRRMPRATAATSATRCARSSPRRKSARGDIKVKGKPHWRWRHKEQARPGLRDESSPPAQPPKKLFGFGPCAEREQQRGSYQPRGASHLARAAGFFLRRRPRSSHCAEGVGRAKRAARARPFDMRHGDPPSAFDEASADDD